MNAQEFSQLSSQCNSVLTTDLVNQQPRTLLFGYDIPRNTYHLYLEQKVSGVTFILIVYDHTGKLIRQWEGEQIDLRRNPVVPDKRLYPEACDYEFCRLLQSKQIGLPFTAFDAQRPPQMFHGQTLQTLPEEARRLAAECERTRARCALLREGGLLSPATKPE